MCIRDRINPDQGEGCQLVTDQGDYRAEKIVLAAGVWSCQLLKRFGIKLPLEAERGYHLVLRNPGVTINNSVMDAEQKYVASLMKAGVRVAGTAEFAGIDEGTIILAGDGVELRGIELSTILRGKQVGEEVELSVVQDGEQKTVRLTLQKFGE